MGAKPRWAWLCCLVTSLPATGCEPVTEASAAAPVPSVSASSRARRGKVPSVASGARSSRQGVGAAGAAAAPASSSVPSAVDGLVVGATPHASVAPPGAAPATSDASTPADPPGCPAGMARVRGKHCRAVEQRCLEYVQGKEQEVDESRCVRFEKPSRCLDTQPPREMDFCMDRWEWPYTQGEKPRVLVDWEEASRLCEDQGKRLCTESEFTFACEGEEMRPYATGFERDPKSCNIDQPWKKRRKHLLPEPLCLASPACKAELARLDGRRPIGESSACESPFGIYELNGNVNEWVSRPWMRPPRRAALKGGWWGPVRNRCRAIALSHDESYVGFEVGFRCCQDLPKAKTSGQRR